MANARHKKANTESKENLNSLEDLNSLPAEEENTTDVEGFMGTLEDIGIAVSDDKKFKSSSDMKDSEGEEWTALAAPDISNSIRMYL
ncbi:MAG: hypothetical protein J6U96_03595, partial [Elusimicrobiaceae bacterium]|nr:hypothetical protein [Elusimicrobiaceae bacterium]